MSALTSLLVRDGVVPVRKIEEALQRQVISGGDIETVLLEMDAVPENVLAAYRAALYELQPASREEIMAVAPEVVGLVPPEVAIEHRLIPLAVHGSVLEVAVREPLSPEREERLGFLLGFDLVARVACDVRLAAGLAHHYAADLPPRFTRLVDRLRKRDSGAAARVSARASGALAAHASDIPYKQGEHFEGRTRPLDPLASEGDRPRRTTHRGLGKVTEEDLELADAAERERAAREAQRESLPRWDSPPRSERSPRWEDSPRRSPVASIPDDDELDGGPVVFPSVTSEPTAAAQEPVASEPAAAEPRAEPSAAEAPRRARRAPSHQSLKLVRGPLTLAAGERMLKRASDRDQILEVFCSYARQFFDYTAIFVVHDDAADGREAWGVGASTEEVQAVSIPLDRPSVFAEARRTIAPQVRRLAATETDRELAASLRRPSTPAALILPIAIRQRVVILLYGDRDGEEFDLGAVMELVRFSSRVIEAFELLILRKKRIGYHEPAPTEARGSLKQAAKAVAETAGRARPSADQRRRDSGAWRAGRRASAPDSADSWSAAVVDARARETHETLELRPALGAPVAGQAAPVEAAPALESDVASGSGEAARNTGDLPKSPHPNAPPQAGEGVPSASDAPRRRARRSPSQVDAPPQAVLGIPRDAPPPPPSAELDLDALELGDMLAEPEVEEEEPEMIVDAVDGEDDDLEGVAELEAQIERDRQRELALARARLQGTYRVHGGPVDIVHANAPPDPPKRTSNRPRARPPRDPRREDDEHGAATEVVRASRVQPPRADVETRSVIVDMGEQVHAQVADLLAAADEPRRAELVRGLLFLGEAALPALVQAFPGPLAWDRRAPDGAVPRGREISVVARALVAFGERAVPYVAALMSAGDADVRFYGALVATELVHPDLMDAVAERIYDPDPGVRRLACALLPRLAGYRGFDEIRVVTRRTARLRGKDPSRRWQAVDALIALRDVDVLDKLIDLLKEDDVELIDHVHRALVIFTCTDLGRSHRRWRAWLDKHGEQHRVEWLIEGLLHATEAVRTLAGSELERLTQEHYGYHAGSPKKERERVQRRYRRWWDEEGQRRFA